MAVQASTKKCIKCAGCVGTCPQSALNYIVDKIVVDPNLCNNCGICVKFCPVGALSAQK